ncbi:putative leucine-rich repeat receptor-like serine/threonine-protein kinase At2g24130 [Cryptomeria japonica]|uniref:putative leucine-rich repeat receptor-like serine/threonine-protein kinase At2g24130 n=1 Tax=Cryptomeria japonica TaxID=3369 RepID=UPI0027DA50E2|nr:putative leucine-rich repeat receptor-like serine/threonine-protein kinase At2g24130 [Cryptomeria japonica]
MGNCSQLLHLHLTGNQLSGMVPQELGMLTVLRKLHLGRNNLSSGSSTTTSILNILTNCSNLKELYLYQNHFSGTLLRAIGKLYPNLSKLSLRSNNITGNVPEEIGNLTVLTIISLGNNNIIGKIPKALSRLEESTVAGIELQQTTRHNSSRVWQARAGSFSSVYRGLLSDNTLVAVKVFDQDPQNSYKNFYKECRILSKIRHRNLVKVLSSCSTPEFRALVLQFMSKGSLEQQLHQDCRLTSKMRLNIALDVAHAMAYLHHDCSPPVVHCDLKPSNVLMDENMTTQVADFGIARLMSSTDSASSSTSMLKGTVGYLAPECGLGGQATTKIDVYSFGVLILEMVTRKKPTDKMFIGNKTLPSWVRTAYPEALENVVDREMVGDELHVEGFMESTEQGRWLVSLIGLALQCTRYSPGERPTMREVEGILERIVYGTAYGNLEEHPSVQSLLTPVRGLGHPNSGTSSSST